MDENDLLVQLSPIQSQSDSQPTSSSLSPSSPSSAESSASPQTLMEQRRSPAYNQPTIRQRLRTIDLKAPSSYAPWKLERADRDKIQAFLIRYRNLEDLEKLNLGRIRADVDRTNKNGDKKVSDAPSGDVNEWVQTNPESYEALIKSLEEIKDNGKNIKSFIMEPFRYCFIACKPDGNTANLDRYLKELGEDLKELDDIKTKYELFQTAEAKLDAGCTETMTEKQHNPPATYERPKMSDLEQCCNFLLDCCSSCCCCRCQRKK